MYSCIHIYTPKPLSCILWPIHTYDADATELNSTAELRNRCELAITG